MNERDIEEYLVKRVTAMGGEIRKVQWVGRKKAPDRRVMLGRGCWVEVKSPKTLPKFPANAHERGQHREHERMRECGEHVEVIGTLEGVDRLLEGLLS